MQTRAALEASRLVRYRETSRTIEPVDRHSGSDKAVTSGADRDRTDDPRLAKPVLSQLSYSPVELELQPACGNDRNGRYRSSVTCVSELLSDAEFGGGPR